MKEHTRYRVTGAVFLLALAAIFLPMILDGEGLPTIEQPALDFAPPGADANPVDAVARAAADTVADAEMPAASVELAPDPAAVDTMVPIEPDAELASTVQELEATVDAEGFDRESRTRLGEPVLADPAREPRLDEENRPTGTWAVQVASFSKRANADDLRQRLRADGFEAFLSTEQRANGPMTRVAIGPFQSRADAVEVRDAVSRRYDVTARLMAFSL